MAKNLDFSKSVYELVSEYPELIDIMDDLGFHEITKKAMLHSVGRIMTIPKGAMSKDIPLIDVVKRLQLEGFEIIDGRDGNSKEDLPENDEKSNEQISRSTSENYGNASERTEQLKGFLRRLSAGEDIETVKADFVDQFTDVEASEIMRAEQEMLASGTPLSEVQKLCDVHSALFHGATKEEKIANAEKAVEESLKKEESLIPKISPEEMKKLHAKKGEIAAALIAIEGHPLETLTRENEVLSELIDSAKEGDIDLPAIREVAVHYAKKGDLIYPLLKVKYQITGPADVMWTVDDEIRDELGALMKIGKDAPDFAARFDAVIKRAEEMVYKEQNILFPICAVNFTEEEWIGIYHDAKDYANCLGTEPKVWKLAEDKKEKALDTIEGEVVMPGGHMTIPQLTAMLNTIPLEISFVDADNINRFFNEGPKVFKRANMAIDRDVFSCHPPKIEPMVRAIIDDFRNGVRDSVPVWMEKGGRSMLVTYMAVRDKDQNYVGTLEVVQDMEFAKEHFLKQK